MKTFVHLLTALCGLAAVQLLAKVAAALLLGLLLMAAVVHPRRTLQLVAAVGLVALALRAPAHSAAALGAAAVALTVAAHLSRARAEPVLLLPDQREP
jgi:hypothetical protein